MLVTIHLIIAIGTGLTVLFSDEQAFMWMRGKLKVIPQSRITFLHYAVTSGLVLLLITGGLLYYQAAPAYLSTVVFDAKMIFIGALIANTYFVDRFSIIGHTREFASLSAKERRPLLISGAISFACWSAVFISGLLIA